MECMMMQSMQPTKMGVTHASKLLSPVRPMETRHDAEVAEAIIKEGHDALKGSPPGVRAENFHS